MTSPTACVIYASVMEAFVLPSTSGGVSRSGLEEGAGIPANRKSKVVIPASVWGSHCAHRPLRGWP